MSTVTKLGVYGLAVAAAFAVAFAVLVTAPRSSVVNAHLTTGTGSDDAPVADASVEAFTESGGGADDNDDTNDIAEFGAVSYRSGLSLRAGDSIYIRVFDVAAGDADPDDDHATMPPAGTTSTLFKFSVLDDGDADATFKAGGGTTLNCNDNRSNCDLDSDWDEMTVELVIADDAAKDSSVVVEVTQVLAQKKVRMAFSVVGSTLAVGALEVDLVSSSSVSRPATFTGVEGTGEAVFSWVVKDNQDTPAGFAGQEVFFAVTGATLRTTGTSDSCREGSLRCTVTSDANGGWVQVRGTGVPGPAKLTVEVGGLTVTKDITFYGPAKTITAEAEQGSIEVGGNVFIVVTVTDGAGNGIAGRSPNIGSGTDSITGPSKNAVKVTAVDNVGKDPAGTANDIPACSTGTNDKGKCVIRVSAPNPSGTANDAARGDHVVTVVGATPIAKADQKVQVTITVAGAVAAVSANAPDRVDPGSTTEITATVVDDEGVRAGAQSVTVTKISGDGVLRNGGPVLTKDGQHKFSYRAASNAGTAEFDVEVRAPSSTGTATDSGKVLASTSFTITVGEEAPPAPPAPEPTDEPWFTPSPSGVAGYINSIFRGGSLSDLQGALLEECSNNGVAAYVTAGGVHVPYIAGARVSAANAAFRSSTVVDGMVPASTIFLIAGCDA